MGIRDRARLLLFPFLLRMAEVGLQMRRGVPYLSLAVL